MSWHRSITSAAAAIAATAGLTVVGPPAVASAGTPAPPQPSFDQTVTVTRPEGQIVVSDVTVDSGGRLELSVTDTRSDDPGWSISVTVTSGDQDATVGWKPYVEQQTRAFKAADGTGYAQAVTAGPTVSPGENRPSTDVQQRVLGSAPRGHGLGIAVLGAKLTASGRLGGGQTLAGATVTVTII